MRQIIYLPGFGDEKTIQRQQQLIRYWWRKKGTESLVFNPRWHTPETADAKIKRLLDFFDEHVTDEAEVYGASAGGPLAMCLFRERGSRISGLKLVCPKLLGHETIGPKYTALSASLVDIVKTSEKVIQTLTPEQRMSMVTYRPLWEGVVPLKDMIIPNARNIRVPSFGHAVTIGLGLLTFLRP